MTEEEKNYKELQRKYRCDIHKTCKYHHDAYHRGYVSRRCNGIITPYKGKFGEGYTLDLPCWNTSYYFNREYFIRLK